MSLSFKVLEENNFPLLLEWLQKAHVSSWYNIGAPLTLAAVQQKYLARILGQELVHCFIIYHDHTAIGFIQFYSTQEFHHIYHPLLKLAKNVAALDFYIADPAYLFQGWGVKILERFLCSHVYKNFDACLVDPHLNNFAAIRCFQKAGFKKIVELNDNRILMLKLKP